MSARCSGELKKSSGNQWHHVLIQKKSNLRRGQEEKSQENERTSDETSKGRLDTALEFDSRAREGSRHGVGTKERSGDISKTKGEQFLVGVDLITVAASKGLRDRNMFENGGKSNGKQLGHNLRENI